MDESKQQWTSNALHSHIGLPNSAGGQANEQWLDKSMNKSKPKCTSNAIDSPIDPPHSSGKYQMINKYTHILHSTCLLRQIIRYLHRISLSSSTPYTLLQNHDSCSVRVYLCGQGIRDVAYRCGRDTIELTEYG